MFKKGKTEGTEHYIDSKKAQQKERKKEMPADLVSKRKPSNHRIGGDKEEEHKVA